MGWSWTERVPCKQGESKQGGQPRQDGFQIKEDRSFFQRPHGVRHVLFREQAASRDHPAKWIDEG